MFPVSVSRVTTWMSSALIGMILSSIICVSCSKTTHIYRAPGYKSYRYNKILLLPMTGVSSQESPVFTKAIERELQRGELEVIRYRQGQRPDFDTTLQMAYRVGSGISMEMIYELGREFNVDAVIVAHRTSVNPMGGVTYRSEFKMKERIQDEAGNVEELPPGYYDEIVEIPIGLIGIRIFDVLSRIQTWNVQQEIKNNDDFRRLLRAVPVKAN